MGTSNSERAQDQRSVGIYRLSRLQYEAMARAGILTKDDRVELIDGVLRKKVTINPPHAHAVSVLCKLLSRKLGDRAVLRVQSPIALSDDSEPEPDLAVVVPGHYRARHPAANETQLIIEVADSTLIDDRTIKGPKYAACGILDYWIVNLVDNVVEVYRSDEPLRIVRASDELRPLAFPDVTIALADVLES